MRGIRTARDGKDYLAGRIAAEAEREGCPLTEVERKMLYFSETDWTLPGMLETNAEFERDCDGNEYERKIAGLARAIESGNKKDEQAKNLWDDAVDKLNKGDNYLSVMLNPSCARERPTARPPHDRLKLWLAAFAFVFGAIGAMALGNSLSVPRLRALWNWLDDKNAAGLPGVGMMALIVLLYYTVGPKVSKAVDQLFKWK